MGRVSVLTRRAVYQAGGALMRRLAAFLRPSKKKLGNELEALSSKDSRRRLRWVG